MTTDLWLNLGHVQNKMPVCKLFLRGACTREDCKYRHVKVSASAKPCEEFLKGYCPKGASCRLKHELPPKKRVAAMGPTVSVQPPVSTASGTLSPAGVAGANALSTGANHHAPASLVAKTLSPQSAPGRENIAPSSERLSIRPKLNFTSRHQSHLSLFSARSSTT